MSASRHLEIPASFEAIDTARSWATGHARAAGFEEEALGELELALTEALANVIEHGYGNPPEGPTPAPGAAEPIELEVRVTGERLELRILDSAPRFDAPAAPPGDLDHVAEGGYGLALMDQLVDQVHRAPRPDGGNELTLVKFQKGVSNG